jgi:hypothetical protein
MKIFLTLVFALILVGCTKSDTEYQPTEKSTNSPMFWSTPKGVIYASEQAIWLQTCANELAHNQRNEVRWFNGIGANDVIFIPKVDPAEEIFLKCESVKPISANRVSTYKKWLDDRILEIQSINTGSTREKVNQILFQNGGLSTPGAAVYSHIECPVLKVRIEFELLSNENVQLKLNENDKVKAISMPYLGLFTAG